MAFVANAVRVLIASPSDLREERNEVERVIHRWNALHAAHVGVVLLPVRWETNASAEMGAPAQDVINRQMVDDSDVLIGCFWTRLGTPTRDSESGTAEELRRFLDAGKPAALFVSRRPADPHLIDQAQFAALRAFLDEQRGNGLIPEFETREDLVAQVDQALTRIIRERYPDAASTAATPTSRPTPTADVRAEHVSVGNNHRVVLQNTGEGEARQVTIETVGRAGEREASWDLMEADTPIDYMPPGANFQYVVALDFGSPPRVNCTVRWVNPDDSEGTSRQTLSIY